MCDDAVLEGIDLVVVPTVRGARGFAFFTGFFATDRFGAAFFDTAFFAEAFFAATFFEGFFVGCFFAARFTDFFAVLLVPFGRRAFAAFLAVFGARAFVVAFALVFLRLVAFLTAVLLRVLAAELRPVAAECDLRVFTRGFLAVFFLAGATTSSL